MTSGPTYLARYRLTIDGQDAPEALLQDIEEIVVESSLYRAAQFTLVINNDYFSGAKAGSDPWEYSNLLTIGKKVAIGFSSVKTNASEFAEGSEQTAIDAEVTAVEADFNEQSQATIVIRGCDVSHRLYRGRFNRSFQNKKDSDIVKDIAREVGIAEGKIDETGGPYGYNDINDADGYVFQHNQTNIEFLRLLAARQGFELWVQARKLNFRKPTANETFALEWLQDIQRFRARASSGEQVSEVELRAWDYNRKQTFITTKATSHLITSTQFGTGRQTSSAFDGQPRSPALPVTNQVFYSQAEGDAIAQSLCDEMARDFIRVEATATGDPNLCPGKAIALSGMGSYSGTYYLTRVSHRFVRGKYETDFSVGGIRGDELGAFLPGPEQGVGTTPKIGIVTNNKDPNKLGRVRVKFPTLTEDHESYWARVVSLGAGPERGWDVLPEINDEVLVLFEEGDIHRPFIVGGLWNGKDKPPTSVEDSVVDGKVRLRTLRTRTGHLLQFVEEDKDDRKKGVYLKTVFGHQIQMNDTEDKITISTPKGYTFVLDEKNKEIEVKTAGDRSMLLDDKQMKLAIVGSANTIVLDDGQKKTQIQNGGNAIELDDLRKQVKVSSGSSSVLLQAAGIVEIKAGAKLSLSAPQIEISAAAQLALKGGAVVQVNGTIVKIN